MPRAAARDLIYRRRRYSSEIIEQCVRWYITYRLSYRDLVSLMAERGVVLTHTTIMRWVFRYVPEYEWRFAHLARPVGSSWRVDETGVKVLGQRCYLYRAVDKSGKSVYSMLSDARTIQAAKAFFRRAVCATGAGWPSAINLDKYYASHKALSLLGQSDPRWRSIQVRDRRYLNNIIEQDHRAIKRRCAQMLGFKSIDHAAVTLAGIELAHRIRKGQYDTPERESEQHQSALSLKDQWGRALAPVACPRLPLVSANSLMHQRRNGPIPRDDHCHIQGPRRVPRKEFLGRGLFLLHWHNGSRYWRYKYRYAGREKVLALGLFPNVARPVAQARRLAARRLLAAGIDPSGQKDELWRAPTPALRSADAPTSG